MTLFRSPWRTALALFSVAAVCGMAGLAHGARPKKPTFGSEFYRAAYENNTCMKLIQTRQLFEVEQPFHLPVSELATYDGEPVRRRNDGLLSVTLDPVPCDGPAMQDPLEVVTDEVVIAVAQVGMREFVATVAGEPCIAEPTIALYGDMRDFYNDYERQIPGLMNSVLGSVGKQCGTAPVSLQVRFFQREVAYDPNQPGTRKQPAGKMLAKWELYAGRYASNVDPALAWQDGGARDGFLEGQANDPVNRQQQQRAANNAFVLENDGLVGQVILEAFGALAMAEYRNRCVRFLNGNPDQLEPSPGLMEKCRELIAE